MKSANISKILSAVNPASYSSFFCNFLCFCFAGCFRFEPVEFLTAVLTFDMACCIGFVRVCRDALFKLFLEFEIRFFCFD